MVKTERPGAECAEGSLPGGTLLRDLSEMRAAQSLKVPLVKAQM